jgi:hypothetical protein
MDDLDFDFGGGGGECAAGFFHHYRNGIMSIDPVGLTHSSTRPIDKKKKIE